MNYNIDSLKILIEKIKSIGFFDRLFYWGRIKNLLIDASADLQKVISQEEYNSINMAKLESTNAGLAKDIELSNGNSIRQTIEIENYKFLNNELNIRINNATSTLSARDVTIDNLNISLNKLDSLNMLNSQKIEQLLNEKDLIKQQYSLLLNEEGNRKLKYENDVSTLNSIRDQIQNDRKRELEDRNNLEIDRLKQLKETWNKHQVNVNSVIRGICNKHVVEYLDQVPFSGEPDNTLKICDEYVIFDAKSPANDDLNNFPGYLKDQAERAKKYARQENVKSDIYFVVPTNTLNKLSQYIYNLADYNVFIIAVDSLEQIILSLKKIEEYEFTEQLSPDERDNICRVLGKFAHLTKRRIQIDSFFAKQFIELAYKTETDLPKDIFEKVVDFERSEKLNPPVEKRAKAINIKELEKDAIRINNDASSNGISINDTEISDGINNLPLYKINPDI